MAKELKKTIVAQGWIPEFQYVNNKSRSVLLHHVARKIKRALTDRVVYERKGECLFPVKVKITADITVEEI